jgi:hypothetical protein
MPKYGFCYLDAPECVTPSYLFSKFLGNCRYSPVIKNAGRPWPHHLGSTHGAFGVAHLKLNLLAVSPGGMSVCCTIRDDDGRTLLRVLPAQEYEFASGGASVNLLGGFPIQLGMRQCKSFAITSDKYAFLAGRFVRPGRLVLFEASLRGTDGTEALVIHRSVLGLSRCSLADLH